MLHVANQIDMIGVLANAGMIWSFRSMGHFLVGNIVLGVIEGLLLAMVFRSSKRRAIGLMIGANYVSAVFGGFASMGVFLALEALIPSGGYIRWMPRVLGAAVAFSFLITIVLEWPSAAKLTGAPQRAWRRTLVPLVGVHLLTYPLLAVWYWSAADLSLYTDSKQDHTLSFIDPDVAKQFWVYSIDSSDNSLYRVRPNGTERERVIALPAGGTARRTLFLWTAGQEEASNRRMQTVDLWMLSNAPSDRRCTKLLSEISTRASLAPELVKMAWSDVTLVVSMRGRFHPTDLREPSDRDWMPVGGVEFRKGSSNEILRSYLFHRWYRGDDMDAWGPIMLKGGLVVRPVRFENPVSRSEIMVMDLDKRVFGVLKGESPVVVFEK